MNLKALQLEGKGALPEGFNHFICDLLKVFCLFVRFEIFKV